MAYLGTTTWRERNYGKLLRVKEEALDRGMHEPSIIDVGPGGLVECVGAYLPTGDKSTWNTQEKVGKFVLGWSERILRKTSLFSLESFEPFEIARMFSELDPTQIAVVDIEQKVLDAVKRANRNHPFVYGKCDIAKEPLPYQGDIVIAYHVAQRTANPGMAISHIAGAVNPNGLLSITNSSKFEEGFLEKQLVGFEPVDVDLYLRIK